MRRREFITSLMATTNTQVAVAEGVEGALGHCAGHSLTSPTLAPRVAQRSFAATDMRLAAFGNRSRDETDCRVGIVTGSTRDGLAGTPVTTKEPRKRGNCLVANLSVWIRLQDVHEVCHNVGNAKLL